jgi:hypothetical protein
MKLVGLSNRAFRLEFPARAKKEQRNAGKARSLKLQTIV